MKHRVFTFSPVHGKTTSAELIRFEVCSLIAAVVSDKPKGKKQSVKENLGQFSTV